MSRVSLLGLLALLSSMSAGCGTSRDLHAWQASSASPRDPTLRAPVESELRELERLRDQGQLLESRAIALRLAAEDPENVEALLAASRAESDAAFVFAEDEERALAALSSLDFAERAVLHSDAGNTNADLHAQLAWALGTTTHLQPMFDRSSHAQLTIDAIEAALTASPEHPVALATLATLRWRLATLPWIARVMAWGAPEGDLAVAHSIASRLVATTPSVEHRLLLAKCLLALDDADGARRTLDAALAAEPAYPRDRALFDELAALRATLD